MVPDGDPQSRMTQIDARGLLCPLPVLKLRKHLLSLPEGSEVTLIATDAAAIIDVPHFCAEAGHEFLTSETLTDGATAYRVRRGANRAD